MGYLEQPHASAGRVPSERGYRFYVDPPIEHYAMTAREIGQINQLLQSKNGRAGSYSADRVSVASNPMTNYTGFAVKPGTSSVNVRRFDVVFPDERTFILVMVASGGQVKRALCARTATVRFVARSHGSACDGTEREHLQGLTASRIHFAGHDGVGGSHGQLGGAGLPPAVKAMYEVMGGDGRNPVPGQRR